MTFDKEKAIRAYEQMHYVNLADGEDAATELIEEWFFPKDRPGETPMNAQYEAAMEIREAIVGVEQTLQRIAAAMEWFNHEHHPHRYDDNRESIPIPGCAICDLQRRIDEQSKDLE